MQSINQIINKSLLDLFDIKITKQTLPENYSTIAAITLDALVAFRERQFSKYDALVTDTACELRAWPIAEWAREDQSDTDFSRVLTETLVKAKKICPSIIECSREINERNQITETNQRNYIGIMNILSKPEHQKYKKNISEEKRALEKATLECEAAQIQQLKVEFDQLKITPALAFIIQSYLLTLTKGSKDNKINSLGYPVGGEISAPKLLQTIYSCPNSIAEKFLKVSRLKLAEASLTNLRGIAEKSDKKIGNKRLVDLLSSDYIALNAVKIPCGPCYYEFETLIEHARQNHLPIIVKVQFAERISHPPDPHDSLRKVDELTLFFECPKEGQEILLTTPDNHKAEDAAIIIGGYCIVDKMSQSEKERVAQAFKEQGLKKVFMANGAQHAQYPEGISAKEPLPQNEEFQRDLVHAKKEGYHIDNPSAFLAKHIYCDTIGKHFNYNNKTECST